MRFFATLKMTRGTQNDKVECHTERSEVSQRVLDISPKEQYDINEERKKMIERLKKVFELDNLSNGEKLALLGLLLFENESNGGEKAKKMRVRYGTLMKNCRSLQKKGLLKLERSWKDGRLECGTNYILNF